MIFRFQFFQTFAILLSLSCSISVFAEGLLIIKPDILQSARYQITDTTGHHVGTLKRDHLDNRRTQILHRDGEPIEYIKPSILPSSTSRYDVFTTQGKRTGTIKQDTLRGDRYHLNGKTMKKDVLRPDRWVVE